MSKQVIAFGLDAAEPLHLERWMDEGYLPNLSDLRRRGAYGRLHNKVEYAGGAVDYSHTEPIWVMFTTGCLPGTTGYWDIMRYDPETYEVESAIESRPYDYRDHPAFFELGDTHRVATFDVPDWQPSPRVSGPQVMGWGGHFSSGHSHSLPQPLLNEINREFGSCGAIRHDHGAFWDKGYLTWLRAELKSSIEKRSRIYRELLRRESCDLFLGMFGETHSAGHDFYFLSQPDHPLHGLKDKLGIAGDPMRDTYVAVDTAIGEILAEAPPDASVACFSVHGMEQNQTDLFSMMMLPELLYRFNFPGKVGIAAGDDEDVPGPEITTSPRRSWTGEIWSRKYEPNRFKRGLRKWTPTRYLPSAAGEDLCSPGESTTAQLSWMPAAWYRPAWPRMRAFALPGFSMGQIRINLAGREAQGIVAREDYDEVCDEICEFLRSVTDARSGEPIVERVIRTRRTPSDNDPDLPDPDLMVHWHGRATDVVDSPLVGRIGPVPYARTGSHRSRGFLFAKDEAIVPGSEFASGGAIDIGPTLLDMMGASPPGRMDGKSLIAGVVGGRAAATELA